MITSGEFKTLKEQYTKIMADAVTINVEDLTVTELAIINKGFEIFESKLEEIKVGSDETKRLSLELSNLKAMGTADDLRYEEKTTGVCPVCKRDDTFRNDF